MAHFRPFCDEYLDQFIHKPGFLRNFPNARNYFQRFRALGQHVRKCV